jgi:hypothetical protein
MLTREVISQAIRKIEADRIIEEKMQIDAIDLYYRPVYAVRYKWQGRRKPSLKSTPLLAKPKPAVQHSKPMSASWLTGTSCWMLAPKRSTPSSPA